jgi:hypothetical protein
VTTQTRSPRRRAPLHPESDEKGPGQLDRLATVAGLAGEDADAGPTAVAVRRSLRLFSG